MRHLLTFLDTQVKHHKNAVEAGGGLELLEKCVRKGLADSSPAVREPARAIFWKFHDMWPSLADKVKDSLDAPAQKQLQQANPNKSASAASAPQTVKQRQSMRELISARRPASRAEAQPRRVSSSGISSGSRSPTASPPPVPALPTFHAKPTSTPQKSRVDAIVGSRERPRPQRPSSMFVRPASVTPSKATQSVTVTPSHQRSSSASSIKSEGRSISPNTNQRLQSPPSRSSPLRSSVYSHSTTPASTRRVSTTPRCDAPSRSSPAPASSSPLTPSKATNGNGTPAQTPIAQREGSPDLMDYGPPSEISGTTRSAPNMSHSPSNNLIEMSFGTDDEVVEDAMKAQAEQAESAAERFLELAEPEEEGPHAVSSPPIGPGGIDMGGALEHERLSAARTTTPTPSQRTMDTSVFEDSPPDASRASSRLIAPPARESWWLKRAECPFLKLVSLCDG
jgi:CLIP-associating protein 1/2